MTDHCFRFVRVARFVALLPLLGLVLPSVTVGREDGDGITAEVPSSIENDASERPDSLALPDGLHPTTVIDVATEHHWQALDANVSPRCSDAAFVRRLYLDLVGRIPTTTERERFLSKTESGKRSELVDLLVESDEYGRRMSELFDAVLMGRGGPGKQNQRVQNGWHDYLAANFNQNRPWNEMVREILLARPKGEAEKGAVWFLYERKDNHQDIAEAIAPGFFGVQIQCAQCHDHPLAMEIEQRHYWGLVAFFNRSKNVDTPQGPRVGESAIGGFAKFTDLSGDASDALLTFLGKSLTVPEERPETGKEPEDRDDNYLVLSNEGKEAVGEDQPRVPKFSRRAEFVNAFIDENPLVARAFVNRIWAMLMGRGISHPVDEMDSMHDPSHPELLDWLARDFERSGFDIKRLVRGIVNCRAYQLDAVPLANASDESTFAWALQKPLSAEVLYRSMLIAVDGTFETEDVATLNRFRDVFPDVLPEVAMTTLKQSLFLSNSKDMQKALVFRGENRLADLARSADNQTLVRAAFLAAYGRAPDDAELLHCMAYLSERNDERESAVGQLMWSLMTSAEFRFNH